MNQFFKELAETLKDRQELRMNIKKIDGDLVIVVTPNFKEEGKTIQMSGTPEEMDENFITEIQKPLSVEKAFESNADEVKEELEEEEQEEKAPAKKETKKPEAKKPVKKADKKAKDKKETKKVEEVEETEEETESNDAPEATETVSETSETTENTGDSETQKEEVKEEPKKEKASSDKKEKQVLFDEYMTEGKRLHSERDYSGSEKAYEAATHIFSDNTKAQEALANAKKWVKAVANLTKETKEEA